MTPTNKPPELADTLSPGQILAWLEAILLFDDGQVELRAVEVENQEGGASHRAQGQLFDRANLSSLVHLAVTLSTRAEAVYFTLNPIKLDVAKSARDEDISRRRLVLIDADPTRDFAARRLASAKLSATDGEKTHALRLLVEVHGYLASRGWPAPVLADSGNGYHLVYAVDLPNDDQSRTLIKGLLQALARRFDKAEAAIDTKVFNASRVCKLYGTLSRKGMPTPDRPHRASSVLEIPADFGRNPVAREMLEAVAALTTHPTPPLPRRPEQPTKSPCGGRGVEDRAIAYLARCPGAVSGCGGHDQTFETACKIGPGFDLDPEAAFRLLSVHWNPTCEPPWSEAELRHKVAEAFRTETRRGWLLQQTRPLASPRAPEQAGGTDGVQLDDERPEILIGTDEVLVNDQAIRAMATDPEIFQRGGCLVLVRRNGRKKSFVERIAESPWIATIPRPTLRERLSRVARWTRQQAAPNSDQIRTVDVHPPEWAIKAVESRGIWQGIPHLEGVVEAPVLLPDGSILATPGHDVRSGLFYEPSGVFPPVPERVTREDAGRAAAEVLAVVADFPFAMIGNDGGAGHRAAYLASLLTPLARFAIDGPCPLFLVDANVSGAGKSKLCDIAAIVATGREAARTSYPDSDEEMRKQILAIAVEGDGLILIDNVKTGVALGGAALNAALTATTIKGRILGKTEMTREVPIHAVWYATGNNLGLKGDLLRRVLHCRLDSPDERPEERKDFQIAGDLLAYAKANRGRLVIAALTILRGYFLAGRPQADLVPMDYPAWCGVVRQAVVWAIGIDPCCTRREAIADDPEANQLRAVIAGWAELPRGHLGLTAAEAVKILKNPDNQNLFTMLRDALQEWSREGDLPSPRSIGKRLKELKGRVVDGKVLRSKQYQGTQSWSVVHLGSSGTRGSDRDGGFVPTTEGEAVEATTQGLKEDNRDRCCGNNPTAPLIPTKEAIASTPGQLPGDLPAYEQDDQPDAEGERQGKEAECTV